MTNYRHHMSASPAGQAGGISGPDIMLVSAEITTCREIRERRVMDWGMIAMITEAVFSAWTAP